AIVVGVDDELGCDRALVLDAGSGRLRDVAGIEALGVATAALFERGVDEDFEECRRERARGVAKHAAMCGRGHEHDVTLAGGARVRRTRGCARDPPARGAGTISGSRARARATRRTARPRRRRPRDRPRGTCARTRPTAGGYEKTSN